MSHTVILDQRAIDGRFENRINEVFRHCRIGRVVQKMQIFGGAMVTPPDWRRWSKATGRNVDWTENL